MKSAAPHAPPPKKKRGRKLKRALLVVVVLYAAAWAFTVWLRGGFERLGPPIPREYTVARQEGFDYLDGGEPPDDVRKLDLLLPIGRADAPVVAVLHGGAWSVGSRRDPPPQGLAQWLAERGAIGAPVGYRLVPSVKVEEQPVDVARAVSWLYRHVSEFGGDPRRIFLLGHSAGAQLVSLIACNRRYLDALSVPGHVPAGVITLGGPFDLREGPKVAHRFVRHMTWKAFGPDQDFRWTMSPQAYVRPGLPPFLIIRGYGDRIVTELQTTEMAEAIRATGGAVETLTVDGREHASVFDLAPRPGDQAGAAILEFVNQH